MKLLIFSDSHRYNIGMTTAVLEHRPDQIIHLGDHESDAEDLSRDFPRIPVCSVPGNCDYSFGAPRYKLVKIGGKLFFLTHGHHYGVKLGYDALVNTALTAGADVCLFGHTHSPYYAQVNGMLVINPGSVGTGSRTYGLMTIENGNITYEKKYVE